MTVEYNENIRTQILSHLDGWKITEPVNTDEVENDNTTNLENTGKVEPFIDNISEYKDNPNKKITDEEVRNFYDTALQKAYTYCNRLNVEDLSSIEEEMFIKGVCLLTASDLWNKFNIRVNNEDLEDVLVQSYGGLLYKQSINILNSFINQRISSLTSLKKQNSSNSPNWFM